MRQKTLDFTKCKSIHKFKLIKERGESLHVECGTVNCSKDLADILHNIYAKDADHIREYFFSIYLNRANRVIGYELISAGGLTGTVADPRLILASAVQTGCTSIVLSHNHPSGNLRPSKADEVITSQIKGAAAYFDIKVLDHIIVNEDREYYSFADEGII
jgi:DNA repair protein RadC